jgi:hypothetical protein
MSKNRIRHSNIADRARGYLFPRLSFRSLFPYALRLVVLLIVARSASWIGEFRSRFSALMPRRPPDRPRVLLRAPRPRVGKTATNPRVSNF